VRAERVPTNAPREAGAVARAALPCVERARVRAQQIAAACRMGVRGKVIEHFARSQEVAQSIHVRIAAVNYVVGGSLVARGARALRDTAKAAGDVTNNAFELLNIEKSARTPPWFGIVPAWLGRPNA
jgi:hypothetical protein